jgi:hypothetical protein
MFTHRNDPMEMPVRLRNDQNLTCEQYPQRANPKLRMRLARLFPGRGGSMITIIDETIRWLENWLDPDGDDRREGW